MYAFSPVANDKIGIGMRNGVDRKSIDFTNTIKDEWTHIVGTWDGSIIKIYQNGLLKNSIAQTFSPPSTETSLTIGRDSGTQYFNGSIDNVSIYNVAKTVEQIKIDYEAGTNSNCVSGQCGLDYVCDDETEPHDKCGAANTCCYTDSRIIPYVNYYYRITATGETGETPSTGIDDPAQTICFPAPEEEEE